MIYSYDRDKNMINRSFNDRIGLVHTSLLRAQQVTAIDKHNDQRTHGPNYLRQLRIGVNARNICSDVQDKIKYTIPHGDGPGDSNTSSSVTTDSIDLTVSPLKGQMSITDRHSRNEGSSYDNTEQVPIASRRQTRASRKNKGIGKTSDRAKLNKAQATQSKDTNIKG